MHAWQRKYWLLPAALLLASVCLRGQDGNVKFFTLAEARAYYQNEMRTATDQVTQRYLRQLEQLKKMYVDKGNTKAAVEVQEEISSLSAGRSGRPAGGANIAKPASPAAEDKPHKEAIEGNSAYDPGDLKEFDKQLDVIEKEFWIAAQLTRTDAFRTAFETKMSKFVNMSRNIQTTLIAEKKVSKDLSLPDRAIRISEIWKVVSKNKYQYSWEYRSCSSRSGFMSSKDMNKPDKYLDWLNALTLDNIKRFHVNRDSSSITPKVSEYFMAIEELRKAIVGIDELDIFE